MTDSVQKVLRFNDFELDIASREMRRNGQLVSLEPVLLNASWVPLR